MLFKFPIPKLNLDGVHLRPLAHHQADAIFKAVDRNRDHLKPWLNWVDDTQEIEDTYSFIKDALKKTGKGSKYACSVWQDEKSIGMISYRQICHHSQQGEIGYWLDKDHTGQGIMSEAVRVFINLGIEQLNLNKIIIYTAEKNRPSQKIPEKFGFSLDARKRAHFNFDGDVQDLYCYSLLAHEWNANSRLDRPDHPA
jgi:ribosomal-protein-serine acetyltransferase